MSTAGHSREPFSVFLSYSGSDRLTVEALARKLSSHGIKPWLDRWNLVPGEPFQPEIERAIASCAACAVLIGRSDLGPWQNEEMRLAIQRRVEEGRGRLRSSFRVIPVLLPESERPAKSALPGFLQGLTWVEFRGSVDDELALRRLVAGIEGREPHDNENGVVAVQECPYRGLRTFREEDTRHFFGRSAQIGWMLSALRPLRGSGGERRFLAVSGASGGGKSSVVRAGLIPEIRSGALPGSSTWPIVVIQPGADPLESLAMGFVDVGILDKSTAAIRRLAENAALCERELHLSSRLALGGSSPEQRLLIVVDQFEELFTLSSSGSAAAFVNNLLYAATVPGGGVLAVIVVRVDFLSRAAEYAELAAAISDNSYLIGPMDDGDLRQAIERPAVLGGSGFEPGLVDVIIEDVHNRPGSLPFLQHSLLELWNRRSGEVITHQSYNEIGRLQGALAKHSSTVYMGLSDEQRRVCRRVVLRLVQPGDDAIDTKRRASLAEIVALGSEGVVREVVSRLSGEDARLLVVEGRPDALGDETVELAHEALIGSWSELRGWLEVDRVGRLIQRRLAGAAREWAMAGYSIQDLYRGSNLSAAVSWASSMPEELAPIEREFLVQSVVNRPRRCCPG